MGADVREDFDRKESLVHALMNRSEPKIEFEQCLKILIENGLDVNHPDVDGSTIFHRASKLGEIELIKIIFNHGGDINKKNIFGNTPLSLSISMFLDYQLPDLEYLNALLNLGADINGKTVDEMTYLMSAFYNFTEFRTTTFVSLLSWIIQHNQSCINHVDKFGRTALHHFVLSQRNDIFSKYTKHCEDILEMLFQKKIDRDLKDKSGKKAVYYTQFLSSDYRTIFQQYLEEPEDEELCKQFKCDAKDFIDQVSPQDPEDFVQRLGKTPGIGSVDNLIGTPKINEEIKQFVEKLSLILTKKCRFGYQYIPELSGSVSEGSKVGFPDEFDYLLFVEGLNQEVMVTDEDNEGYVSLKFKENSINEEFTFDGFFEVRNFSRYFHHEIWPDSFNSMVSTITSHDRFYRLSCKTPGIYKTIGPDQMLPSAATEINLSYRSDNFGDIHISIDVVPVVKSADGWRPKNFKGSFPLQNQDRFCILLQKCVDNPGDQSRLRVSTSFIEKRIINEFPPETKNLFIALKAFFGSREKPIISSYVIKNEMIRRHVENPDETQKDVSYRKDIIDCLNTLYGNDESVFSYFFPNLMIRDGLKTFNLRMPKVWVEDL